MPEETPQLPVSEQEIQIEAPSFFDKIKLQKKKILIGLGVFFGFLILAGAVFGVYKYTQNQIPLEEPIPTPLPAEVSTEEGDLTADWGTYINIEYKYRIEYPSEWRISEVDQQTIIYEGDDPYTPVPYKFGRIIITEEENPKKISSIEEWWDEKYLPKKNFPMTTFPIKVKLFETDKNLEVLEADPLTGGDKARFYVLSPEREVITLTFSSETSDQIITRSLSSFKFLEEEIVNCEEPRPEICTMECIVNPPYICGSDGKSHCSTCQACAKPNVEWYVIQDEPCGQMGSVQEESCGGMSLSEAREIALGSSCLEEGSLTQAYSCNEGTGTWWIDLEVDKPGCAPACVINVSTEEAEINWRCTGLIPD